MSKGSLWATMGQVDNLRADCLSAPPGNRPATRPLSIALQLRSRVGPTLSSGGRPLVTHHV
jgi:hypothetical protein